MVNRIRIIYPSWLNKRSVWGPVRAPEFYDTPEIGQRIHQPKHCEYNNKDDNNSPNTLKDKELLKLNSNTWKHLTVCKQMINIE